MITPTKQTGFLRKNEKILYGIHKAFYKLVLKSAAKGDTLILNDAASGSNEVPAKRVLEKLMQEYPEEIEAFQNDGFPL